MYTKDIRNDMEKKKIFISCSGKLSTQLGGIIDKWLPSIFQTVETFFYGEAEKGVRWLSEISKELEESDFGILCITKENLSSPWIFFEAGALSKKVTKAHVYPILFDVKPTDLHPALGQFRSIPSFSKNEIEKLIKNLNMATNNSVRPEHLEKSFSSQWLYFKKDIDEILTNYDYTDKDLEDKKSTEEILNEMLYTIRNVQLTLDSLDFRVPAPAFWPSGGVTISDVADNVYRHSLQEEEGSALSRILRGMIEEAKTKSPEEKQNKDNKK